MGARGDDGEVIRNAQCAMRNSELGDAGTLAGVCARGDDGEVIRNAQFGIGVRENGIPPIATALISQEKSTAPLDKSGRAVL